jgi:uncharacterized C2H2 Zn-finger protein
MKINGKEKVVIQDAEEVNQCPTCGELFNSFYAFDCHRTGDYGKNRRCLTIPEMLDKGMGINYQKRWVSSLKNRPIEYSGDR